MIIDNLLRFTGTSNGAAAGITATSAADAPTTGTQTASNLLDLGVNSGVPSSANGGGARDLGIGDSPALELLAAVTVTFTSGTSLQLQLAGAPDNGSGAAGSFTVMWTSFAFLEAALLAGVQLANVTLPRTLPGQVLPRFLRLQFITVGTHVTGQIECEIVLDRDDQIYGGAGGVAYGGYPAGITVAN